LTVPPLKALKLIKAIKAADKIAKLPASARPLAKFLYYAYHTRFLPGAPHGLRSFEELVKLGHGAVSTVRLWLSRRSLLFSSRVATCEPLARSRPPTSWTTTIPSAHT
jgi:hypothetical protein